MDQDQQSDNKGWEQEQVLQVGDVKATITSKDFRGRLLYCYVCNRDTGHAEFSSKYLRPRDIEDHKKLLDLVGDWFAQRTESTPVERPRARKDPSDE